MAQDDRTFQTSTPAANRAEMQGLGVGQKELNAQQAPKGDQHALDPERTEPFETDAQPRAEASGQGRSFDDRNAAGMGDAGDLGAATPPGVDIHDIGQDDKSEQEWGDETEEGMSHSANHTRRDVKTEAERGQGAKTRQANKDIISRRS
jgi:hypothetical protein